MLFDSYKFIDLTHLMTPNIPTWENSCGFKIENMTDYDKGMRTQKMFLYGGIGTHLDAPDLLVRGGSSVDDIALEKLIVQACVLDVSSQTDANYQITAKDIQEYEKKYGQIPENSCFIGYTGWSRFWPDHERYRNPDSQGQMHFPSFSIEAAQLLLEREVAGIGIDTLSPDCDPIFPVHKLLLSKGKYIVENMANCHLMPPTGAHVLLLPLNMDSTECAIRAVGVIPKNRQGNEDKT